jgi:hypothetical protein
MQLEIAHGTANRCSRDSDLPRVSIGFLEYVEIPVRIDRGLKGQNSIIDMHASALLKEWSLDLNCLLSSLPVTLADASLWILLALISLSFQEQGQGLIKPCPDVDLLPIILRLTAHSITQWTE